MPKQHSLTRLSIVFALLAYALFPAMAARAAEPGFRS